MDVPPGGLMERLLNVRVALALLAILTPQLVVAQAQGAPKPGPEHARLGYFVGKWRAEGDVKPGPMGPGGKMTSNDTCEWFEGRLSVICRYEGSSPMGPTKGLGILGYSSEEKVYTYYAVDNLMAMASVPKGTVRGDTWTYTDEATFGGSKVKSRVTLKELSPTSHTFKLEIQGPDGKWMPMVETRNTKISS
jgi:hypothetical protein